MELPIEIDGKKYLVTRKLEFNTTPVPAYIVDDEVYFGGKILNTENKFAYYKYDFNKKKLSDFKYNTVE